MSFWSLFRGLWYRIQCNQHLNCLFDDIYFNITEANYTVEDIESYVGSNTTEVCYNTTEDDRS